MKPDPLRNKTQSVDLAVAVFGALVAVTCAAGLRPDSKAPATVAASAPQPGDSMAPGPASPQATPAIPNSAAPPPKGPTPPPKRSRVALKALGEALRGLSKPDVAEPVRILWMGDSHTYADFLPHAVRRQLQRKYGAGGPGYLLLGVKPYRNDLARIRVEGKWRREPRSPSKGAKQLDGVFGLAGQRSVPVSADASASVELLKGKRRGRVGWTLHYRLPGNAALKVELSDGSKARLTRGSPIAGSPILRHRLESDASAKLTVSAASGLPELFGVVVETSQPGVVVDNLGINGARAGTPLVWDESSHVAEIAARKPSLVILAYGTNEAASALSADRVVGHFRKLTARVRRAAPDADCLLIGPTDMADESGGSRPRVSEIDAAVERAAAEVGCGYISAFQAMGGEGSFAAWMKETPPLGSPDRIHLTPKGYAKLGDEIFQRLALP